MCYLSGFHDADFLFDAFSFIWYTSFDYLHIVLIEL